MAAYLALNMLERLSDCDAEAKRCQWRCRLLLHVGAEWQYAAYFADKLRHPCK